MMNKSFFNTLINWPKPYIFGTDLCHVLDKSNDSRYGIIKRAVQEGYLIPIRRDLYLIKNPKMSLPDSFQIALLVYGPSYISFESALSYHGWIPEAVRTTTCATVKRTREFDTPIGFFSYQHIPIKAFSFGIEQHYQNNCVSFIAAPEKALADMIYARKRSWKTINDLSGDLRIEFESFQSIDHALLEGLITNYPNDRVKKVLYLLQKGL